MHRNHGYTLAEVIVAVVIVGIVLGPLLLFATRLHDMNSAVGQQARKEGLRSFHDQVVVTGVSPGSAPALSPATNLAVPEAPAPGLAAEPTAPNPGVAAIVPVRLVPAERTAEARLGAGGFQIGPGAAVAPRSQPAAPLPPIVLTPPSVSPEDGSVLALSDLHAAGEGAPYVTEVLARAQAGARVHLVFNQPHRAAAGISVVEETVTAVDLVNLVHGSAWAEYAGDPAAGDRPVVLGDGRTRWLVTRPDGRTQIYEPSRAVAFSYRIALGSPVVVRGTVPHLAGTTVEFDYAGYLAVRGGTILRIDFPAATKMVFGDAWPQLGIGYNWTFGGEGGPFDGNIRPFFEPEWIAVWSAGVSVAATPVVRSGAWVEPGEWTFRRLPQALAAPVLATGADRAGFHVPGQLQFAAPPGIATQVGARLSFENGTRLSTGSTLSFPILP